VHFSVAGSNFLPIVSTEGPDYISREVKPSFHENSSSSFFNKTLLGVYEITVDDLQKGFRFKSNNNVMENHGPRSSSESRFKKKEVNNLFHV